MKFTKLFFLITIVSSVIFYACKDKSSDPNPGSTDKCASKNIAVTATVTPTSKCSSVGQIVANATGSTGFTYQLNSGTFQSSSTFSNLAEGNYTITAKDADGCTKSAIFVVGESGAKGPLFTAVVAVINTKCNGGFCHGTGDNGAPTQALNTDCNIIARKNLINTKVLGAENMGSLGTNDKKKISDWLAAGGKYTD
jgi:hypothetical protein